MGKAHFFPADSSQHRVETPKLALQGLASMSGSSSLQKGKFLSIWTNCSSANQGRQWASSAGLSWPASAPQARSFTASSSTLALNVYPRFLTQLHSQPPCLLLRRIYKCLNICFAVTSLLPKHFMCSCSVISSQRSWRLLSRFVADIEGSKHRSVLSLESRQLEDK